MKKTVDIIGKSIAVFGIMFLIWFVLSWAEVVAHNLDDNPTYHDYNMFVLMTENYNQK